MSDDTTLGGLCTVSTGRLPLTDAQARSMARDVLSHRAELPALVVAMAEYIASMPDAATPTPPSTCDVCSRRYDGPSERETVDMAVEACP